MNQRVGQDFFRRAVLANYEETCCITGIADPRLLTASHIKPWGKDSDNRHNPANGLLLSATLDRAFDRGLISSGMPRPQERRMRGTERAHQEFPLRYQMLLIVTRMGRDYRPGLCQRIEQVAR